MGSHHKRAMMLRNGHAIILAALALVACGHAPDQAEPTAPGDEQAALFDKTADYMLAMSQPRGWIVSQWDSGEITHTGDSLLWTGMAMGVLDCKRGAEPEAALLAMLAENDGKAYRHPTERARATSLDGHLGLYWGIKRRVERCPESRDTWAAAFQEHKPRSVPDVFLAVRDSVKASLGIGAAPSAGRVAALVATVTEWARVVAAKKAAGYRIHLGLLAVETVGISEGERGYFCGAAAGNGLLTTDHFCGLPGLAEWASGFVPDQWEYRSQRASWESADGKPGLHTPALDLLVAMRALYHPLPFRFRMVWPIITDI